MSEVFLGSIWSGEALIENMKMRKIIILLLAFATATNASVNIQTTINDQTAKAGQEKFVVSEHHIHIMNETEKPQEYQYGAEIKITNKSWFLCDSIVLEPTKSHDITLHHRVKFTPPRNGLYKIEAMTQVGLPMQKKPLARHDTTAQLIVN